MELRIAIRSDDLSPEDLQKLTRDLKNTINRETDAKAAFGEESAPQGAKVVDFPSVGMLIIQYAIPHAAEAILLHTLVNFLRSRWTPKRSLAIESEALPNVRPAKGPQG